MRISNSMFKGKGRGTRPSCGNLKIQYKKQMHRYINRPCTGGKNQACEVKTDAG